MTSAKITNEQAYAEIPRCIKHGLRQGRCQPVKPTSNAGLPASIDGCRDDFICQKSRQLDFRSELLSVLFVSGNEPIAI